MEQTIQFIDRRLAQLRALIPLYKWKPPLEKWLASEIIYWQIRRNEYLNNHTTPILQQPQLSVTTSVQNQPANPDTMPSNLTDRSRQTANTRAYWQFGQPVGAPARYFRQIRYLPLPNAVPDLDKALSGAWLDCGQDLHKQLGEFGGAVKVWTTVQVAYEPVKPMANKEPFEQYLGAAPTRIFRSDGPVTATENPYIDSLRILTDRIKEFNAKFIRDKSGLRLTGVLQLVLNLVQYAPLKGRGWQPLFDFLTKTKAIINIQNYDERCFGYALLYFLERHQLPEKHCERENLYTAEMFRRYHLETLPYPIAPNDVHLYEDQLQMKSMCFRFLITKVVLAIPL